MLYTQYKLIESGFKVLFLYEVLGSIFYIHTVVGDNIYSIYTKMGGRIHRTSHYNAYMGVYNYIYKIIYV